MLRTILLFLVACGAIIAAGPVYVVLWFDTEDYVLPASDDAALRIAKDLTRLGVRATFKVVGEKARVLESRGRFDVIRVEDLKVHSMTKSPRGTIERPGRNVRRKAGLNRSILASGWGLLVARLEQKAPGRVEKEPRDR